MIGDAAIVGRQPGDARKREIAAREIDGDAVVGKLPPEQGRDPDGALLPRLDGDLPSALVHKGEARVRPGHGEPAHDTDACAKPRPFGATELAPGWHRRAPILNSHTRAGRPRPGFFVPPQAGVPPS